MPSIALLNWAPAQNDGPMPKFIEEIKRRNVFKVAVVYIIAGWLTMQVVDVMFPALNIPDWFTSAIAALVIIGFPFALIFAWAFEMTPEGIKLEKDVDRSESITSQTSKKLNGTIIAILAVALGFMLVDKFLLTDDASEATGEIAAVDIKPSIAVLPFVNMSDDKDNEYFSDGLSEELLNLLAKIPALHVAGRTSSFQFKGTNEDLRLIGEKLNVANVLEGSVRQSGTKLRITAQLINADTGYHLWSETYDRELTDVFAIQDEIAANVVSALRLTLLGEDIPKPSHGRH
jgi:TolB-like protein